MRGAYATHTTHLGTIMEVSFKSLTEIIGTTTSGGKLIFHIFRVLAVFEREVIRERTNGGLQAARAGDRLGDRPKIEALDPKKIALAKKLYADRNMPVTEISNTLDIGRSTLYRYIQSAQGFPILAKKGSAKGG